MSVQDRKPVTFYNNPNIPDIVELKNVSQTYDGKKYIIKDLNLLIEEKPSKSQFVTILGASGCGKSTLLRYIAGLQKPTSGEVFVNAHPREEKDYVGMVFQKYSSFPWLTVIQNIELGLTYRKIEKKEKRERAREMIKFVGLEGQENKFAQYPILSGGQLQRVAIARSLLANPKILLMDEPFGALDIKTRLKMQELINMIWHKIKMTIVFVTHDISEAIYLGDEICIMSSNPGTIVERIQVPLPEERNKEMKRIPQFTKLVYDLEDKIYLLENK